MAINGRNPGQDRDNQRQRVYDAERDGIPRGKEFNSFSEMQAYLTELVTSEWFRSMFNTVDFVTIDPNGTGRKGGGNLQATGRRWNRVGRITMTRYKCDLWTELILLHELGHCIQPDRSAWHGPEFTGIYALLVSKQMGLDAGAALLRSFQDYGVDVLFPSPLV